MNINRYIRKKFRIRRGDKPPFSGWKRNTTRKDLADLFAEVGFTYGAEVGVQYGRNANMLFKQIPNLKLRCVDPWSPYGGHGTSTVTEENAAKKYEYAKKKLKGYDVIWMKMKSMQAVQLVDDNSLDFVYIDALHNFDNVMMDIINWVPKVKKGGIVSGHDYLATARIGVVRAVDAYVFAHGIRNLYLTREIKECPSWFWVNG